MPKVCLVTNITKTYYDNDDDCETLLVGFVPVTDWTEVTDEEYQALLNYSNDYSITQGKMSLLSIPTQKEFKETINTALEKMKIKKEKQQQALAKAEKSRLKREKSYQKKKTTRNEKEKA
jgi:hypothetical protein